MIQSKPKTSSILSISLFLIGTLAVAVWLIVELVQHPTSYFWVKLILAPLLMVIGILVATRSFLSAISLSLGNNRLSYRYLIGTESQHKIADISLWKEDIVKNKSSVFKQLTIELSNGKKLQLSNHENSHYDQVVGYLKKKVKNK